MQRKERLHDAKRKRVIILTPKRAQPDHPEIVGNTQEDISEQREAEEEKVEVTREQYFEAIEEHGEEDQAPTKRRLWTHTYNNDTTTTTRTRPTYSTFHIELCQTEGLLESD
jgi:hypothetical protein